MIEYEFNTEHIVQYYAIIISFIKTKIKFYTTKLIHIKDMQLDM